MFTGTPAPATSFISTATLENQLGLSNVVVSTASDGPSVGNLTVEAPITWTTGNRLTLEAANNISIGLAAPITAAGGGSLTLEAGASTSILSPIKTTGLITVTGPAGINLAADITTAGGAITFNNPVQLQADVVTVNAGAGTVRFGSTVNSVVAAPSGPCAAGCDLTVSGGGVTFGGNVGSAEPLGSLFVTGPTTLAGNVTTNNGDIEFNDSVQLQGNVTVNSGAGGTVAFDSTVDSAPAFPSSGLTVSTGDLFLEGALGGTSPLGAVSLTSLDGLFLPSIIATGDITLNNPAFLNGNITTSGGSILFGDTVALESSIALSAPSGRVAFGSTVDTDPSGSCGAACDFTVSASAINFGGPLGGFDPLAAVSLTSKTVMTLSSITAATLAATSTAGAITLGGAVTVPGAVDLTAAGDIVQQSGAAIDATNLAMNSTGGGIVLDALVDPPGPVSLTAFGDIVEGAGAPGIVATSLSAISTAGRVVLTSANDVVSVSGSAPLGFTIADAVPLSVGGITSTSGPIALGSLAGITQTGPITGQSLYAGTVMGDIILTNANNSVATIAGTGGVHRPVSLVDRRLARRGRGGSRHVSVLRQQSQPFDWRRQFLRVCRQQHPCLGQRFQHCCHRVERRRHKHSRLQRRQSCRRCRGSQLEPRRNCSIGYDRRLHQ